jgi:hypothetical protein
MRKYLVCYWTERNDVSTDLEIVIEADNIREALDKFHYTHHYRRVSSISELI